LEGRRTKDTKGADVGYFQIQGLGEGLLWVRLGNSGSWVHHRAEDSRSRFKVKTDKAKVQNIGDKWGIRDTPRKLGNLGMTCLCFV